MENTGTTSVVQRILDRSQFVEEIDGAPFTLRKITAEMSLSIMGKRSLGLIRGAGAKGRLPEDEAVELANDLMPKFLKLGMVIPKLGDVTDPENEVICLEDLGGLARKVFDILFERSGYGKLGNFRGSFEEQTEPNSQ